MAKITYVEFNGAEHIADVESGLSVMRGAKQNGIPGIDADCGGACQCGTCHVYVDEAWRRRIGPRTELESAILDFAEEVTEDSRLACQITVTGELDGLVVRMPESQR
jgi:2Fe-2S ferredoxin